MGNENQPPGGIPPAPSPSLAPRKYTIRCWLENNTTVDVKLESFDHVGALAKLVAVAAELVLQQPFRMLRVEFVDTTGSRLILPAISGRG